MTSAKPKPDLAEVDAWLNNRYKTSVQSLMPLAGGFWSAAYAFTLDNEDLVLRLGESGEGYLIDEKAYQFVGPGLPIPEVTETGKALGLAYAISKRHYGTFVENTALEASENVGNSLSNLLQALRAVPRISQDRAVWYRDDQQEITWHDWLLRGLTDRAESHSAGWRGQLAENPELDAVFEACDAKIRALLHLCPSRGDLIHGDLLHQNVLVNESADEVTAIFSWKCSARGDFLYDVAWCTLWAPWHPAIESADLWSRVLAANDLSPADLKNAAIRHHCYELQIAATHMAGYVWTENETEMARLVAVIETILARGPHSC